MKHTEKLSAFETTVGKYSNRKVPEWRLGPTELQEYLNFAGDTGTDSETVAL